MSKTTMHNFKATLEARELRDELREEELKRSPAAISERRRRTSPTWLYAPKLKTVTTAMLSGRGGAVTLSHKGCNAVL
jgi:hypothetical protein